MKEPLRSWKGATLASPLYRRIALDFRRRIADGSLPHGVRLPSSRALASRLGVSRNTVTAAYETLAAEGLLTTRIGSGTRVNSARRVRLDARTLLRDAHYPGIPVPLRDPDGNPLYLHRSC
jgi:DNA-binding GntR family transcriptional regulator